MICDRGGCGGDKPDPHPVFAFALLLGVVAVLAVFQLMGPLLK